MKLRVFAGVALAVTLGFAASGRSSDQRSIAETVASSDTHTILYAALKESGQYATLNGKGPYTLFAPTDAAFTRLGEDVISNVLSDKEALKQFLLSHVVVKNLQTGELKLLDGGDLNGFPVAVGKDGLTVGGAKVVLPPMTCSNGTLYILDGVLIRPKK